MRTPIFIVALAYAGGLALFADVDDSPRLLLLLALATLALGAATLWLGWTRTTLACALTGFLLLGGAGIRLAEAAVSPTRIDRLLTRGWPDLSAAVRMVGWLRRAPEHKPFGVFYELELESVETGGVQRATSGGVRLAYYLRPKNPPPESLPPLRYGDRVEVLLRLHRPLTYQNPGSFDWRAHLARRDIYLEGTLRNPLLLEKISGRRGLRLTGWIQALRARLLRRLDRLVPPRTQSQENAVLRAMLLGDRAFLRHRLVEQFRRSGAYHVLVISGLHVGVIAMFMFWLLQRVTANEWVVAFLTIAGLIFYLLIVEDRPPIERAVWMVSLYLAARLLFRQVQLANPASLAALLLLFLHPRWLFEPSFHFTFGAVFLVAFFALPWMERTSQPRRQAAGFLDAEERDSALFPPRLAQFRLDLRALAALLAGAVFWTREKERAARSLVSGVVRTGLRAWDFFLISFAIHLGFVLLTAFYFHRVFWAGLLANMVVVPLVGIIVPLGLTALALPLVGSYLAAVTSALVGVLLSFVNRLAALPLSHSIPPPPLWLVLVYLAALVSLALAVAHRRHQRWAAAALALPLLLVVTHPFPPDLPQDTLEVTVLDVGQGDSLFLAFPNGETWLIDGGGGPREVEGGYLLGRAVGPTVVAPYLRTRGLKRLDRVWLTHAHKDHMAGLHTVVEEFDVGNFNVGALTFASRSYQSLAGAVAGRGIPIEGHRAGERFAVGDVAVEILWPGADYAPEKGPSNNDSLVLRLCRLDRCLLLPGDIEPKLEKKLAQSASRLRAEAVKVPHHGGVGTAGEEFLAAIRPQVAVVSVGARNPHEHPRAEVLARLAATAGRVYRTDRDGSITLQLTRTEFRAASFRERQRTRPYPNLWTKLLACARRIARLESAQWAVSNTN